LPPHPHSRARRARLTCPGRRCLPGRGSKGRQPPGSSFRKSLSTPPDASWRKTYPCKGARRGGGAGSLSGGATAARALASRAGRGLDFQLRSMATIVALPFATSSSRPFRKNRNPKVSAFSFRRSTETTRRNSSPYFIGFKKSHEAPTTGSPKPSCWFRKNSFGGSPRCLRNSSMPWWQYRK